MDLLRSTKPYTLNLKPKPNAYTLRAHTHTHTHTYTHARAHTHTHTHTHCAGTGKTLLARTAARALGAQLLCVDAPELVGGVYGDSERRIAELFASARYRMCSLINVFSYSAVLLSSSPLRGIMIVII